MKYICTYDYLKYKSEDRYGKASTAARPIIEYIYEVLNAVGVKTDIISVRRNMSKKGKYPERTTNLNSLTTLTLPPSRGSKYSIVNKIDELRVQIWLIKKLLLECKCGDTILVYHKMSIMIPILIAKKIKHLHLMCEVAEIFTDVYQKSTIARKLELYFLRSADSYIFSSKGLNNIINSGVKPYITLYGSYKEQIQQEKKWEDSRIHIVYAGKLELLKGVGNVIAAAKILDSDFVIHILGAGDDPTLRTMNEKIDEVNSYGRCQVVYEGAKYGDSYNTFLQSCTIGLCCQDNSAKFNSTSFPSKILSYLSNGLCVVSSKIEAVEESPFAEYITFYEDNTPENIATAIIKQSQHTENKHGITDLFKKLDKDFQRNIERMIQCN